MLLKSFLLSKEYGRKWRYRSKPWQYVWQGGYDHAIVWNNKCHHVCQYDCYMGVRRHLLNIWN